MIEKGVALIAWFTCFWETAIVSQIKRFVLTPIRPLYWCIYPAFCFMDNLLWSCQGLNDVKPHRKKKSFSDCFFYFIMTVFFFATVFCFLLLWLIPVSTSQFSLIFYAASRKLKSTSNIFSRPWSSTCIALSEFFPESVVILIQKKETS